MAFRIGPLGDHGAHRATTCALSSGGLRGAGLPGGTRSTAEAGGPQQHRMPGLRLLVYARQIANGCSHQGSVLHTVQVASRLQINESRALMSAALDGFGIVLGPEDFSRLALAKGELVRVLPDFDAPSRPMHLVYTANRQRTAKLRRFVEAVLERFGPA